MLLLEGAGITMKVFFATDIHGSEICWRKFLNAAAFYKADMVVLGGDVTGSLNKLPGLLSEQPGLAPPYPRYDPLTQAKQLLDIAESVPKGLKWKARARVGDKVRWYELPEEVGH